MWEFCLSFSIILFFGLNIAGIMFYRRRKGRKNPVSLATMFIGATYISVFVLNFPMIWQSFEGTDSSVAKTLLLNFRISLQTFSLDGEYMDLYQAADALSSQALKIGYQIFGVVLYVLAPALLVGFIATLFQSMFEQFRLWFTLYKNIYIFSELNEKSLALGTSCADKDGRNALVVYLNVDGQNEDELTTEANQIGAACLQTDILHLRVNFERKKKDVRFFLVGENEAENIGQALSLIQNFEGDARKRKRKKNGRRKKGPQIYMYVLTDSPEGGLMLESAMNKNERMEIRRINSAQSLVYSYLYDTDHNRLFDLAQTVDGQKILCVVIVGLGRHGMELLRALVWYGQLPDIRLQIHIFEQDPLAEQKLTSLCPELMEENHNHTPGESQYDIWFHHGEEDDGIDARTRQFDEEILKLTNVSIAYVALGDDTTDIHTAVKLRRLFTQTGQHPVIQAVVFDPKRSDLLKNYPFHDFRDNAYDIGVIGDLDTEWSYSVIVQSGLEKEALKRHVDWAYESAKGQQAEEEQKIREFYQYEYFRKSSMSGAIRARVRRQMQVPGAAKPAAERTPEEKTAIRRLEHAGWVAYMRSEGYHYGPQKDDLARSNPLLVPFDELPEDEKMKDDD